MKGNGLGRREILPRARPPLVLIDILQSYHINTAACYPPIRTGRIQPKGIVYMRQPSFILECNSLIPTLTRRGLPSLPLQVSTPGETVLPPLITGLRTVLVECDTGCSTENTSTIHSYQTFRSSVCLYIVTTISPLSGTLRGV